MARNITLLRLLDQLRAEARLSKNPAHNQQVRDTHVDILQRTQDRIWDDFTWPHLRVDRLKAVQTNQRYYAPPPDIQIDNIERIELYDGGEWKPLSPNIDGRHYSAHNSDRNEATWPPMRWKIYEGEQVEIWPIGDHNGDPETMEGMLKFIGIRNLRPLVKDSDRADLDDHLLVLYAAAEILAAAGAKDAQVKLDQANAIYRRLRSGLTPRRSFKMFGIGMITPPPQEFVVYSVKGGSIAGPSGPAGASGQRGSVWTTGSGPPSPDTASLVGDMYLNEANGDVWRYDGGSWVRR